MTGFEGKHVVVLGGAGFLGSHLCERLLAEETASVHAIDNFITGQEENLASLRREGNFRFTKADITAPLRVTGPVDIVFNLASPASPIDYDVLWLETLRTGSLGTENALWLADEKKAVFFQASTSEIYGDPLVHPQAESYLGNVDLTGPRAVYDEAKRYGEAIVSAFRRKRGLSTRIVRIFNTYGPRMRLNDGRVVPAFIGQALRGEDFTLFGDGTQTRSFCYVSDLIDGFLRLAASQEMDPVNIGNPTELTLIQFAQTIKQVFQAGGKLTFKPLPQGDPKQRRPDITRARTLLGWEPRVSLDEGLKKTWDYFKPMVA